VGGLTPPREPSVDELRGEIERLRRLVADRSHDLALLAETSREITATLDLDRVLRAVVNLAMRALPFDRGAVALYEQGQCDVRAVAGADTVDRADPSMQDLAARAAWAAGVGESFYLSDRAAPASDAERIFLQIFGPDLEAADVGSGLYLPLRDEEGVVGVLLFEATRPDFADERQREMAAILANQATVAVRNAQLYSQVPLADMLGAFGARKRALLEVPRRRRLATAALALIAVGALTLVRWPLRVPGADPLFRPTHRAEVRALVPGVVERVFVREGAAVARGQPVAQLRDAELRSERAAVAASAEAAERDAALAASRGDAGEERVQRVRAATLRRESEVLDAHLGAMVLRSSVSGVVLTTRPEERLGARLDEGDALLLVGRTDTLELEFGVDQRDIARVAVGDEVRLRVDALPQRTFSGRVASLGQVPSELEGRVTFPVRAAVENDGGLLRPGMAAHARVLTAPASAAGRLLRAPLRQARLLWWRMWS
jgi:biotin carboxyl carrier protein